MTKIQIYQTPSDVIASEAKQSHGIASSLSLLAMTTFFEGISNLPALLNMCRVTLWFDLSRWSRKVKSSILNKII